MIITQLIKKNNKMIIVFDTGDDMRIHYDVFIRNGLRRGDELLSEAASLIQSQSDLQYAKESALRILGIRMHSIRELKQKLMLKKYDISLIKQVIDDLCSSGYLDDAMFTKQYVQEKTARKVGIQKIRSELLGKGISKEIINAELSQVDYDMQLENAARIAEKKAGHLHERGIEGDKLKQKLYAFLLSRGYDFEVIRKVLDKNN